MNNPIQLKEGDHFFFHHDNLSVKAEVAGFEVYEQVNSPVSIEYRQPDRPVFVWRIMATLLEEVEPVFSKNQTICVYPHSVISKAP